MLTNKKILWLLFIVFILLSISAVPRLMNYQGKLLDDSGVGLNRTVTLTFKLFTSEIGGEPLWTETQDVIVTKGLFSVILGNVTEIPDTVDFSEQYYLEVSVDGEIMSAREKLTSTPYSLRAGTADRAFNPVYSEIDTTPRSGDFVFRPGTGATMSDDGSAINITVGGSSLYAVLLAGNNAGGEQIKNLAEPTDASDAVTKQYADNISAEAGGVNTVSGGQGLSPDDPAVGSVVLDVKVDDSTIEIFEDNLRVKPSGITSTEILNATITSDDIAENQITEFHLATDAVGPDQLQATTVTEGTYNNATITVDADGRIISADHGAVSGLGGGGTVDYIAKFTDGATVGNSDLYNSDGRLALGTTSPDASAGLELSGTDRGFLVYRMTQAQRDAISSPATGLMIYNTTTDCFNVRMPTTWKQLCGECDFTNPTLTNNSPICAGATLNLQASYLEGAEYFWTGPNAFSSTLQNPSIPNITTSGAGLYSLQVTKDGCTGTAVTSLVTVNTPPSSPTVINGPSSVCENQTDVAYSISPVAGANHYNWTVPTGASITSGQGTTNITVTFGTSSGDISVSAEDTENGCGPSSATNLSVTVNALPVSTFTPSGAYTNIATTFTPSVSGATYSWSFASGSPSTSSDENPIVTWSSSGTYNVTLTVTDLNGCSSTTVQPVSVGDPPSGGSITTAGGYRIHTFTSSGTFSTPTSMTVEYLVVGGGGGGGDGNAPGGGGGAGGFVEGTKEISSGSYTINIGSGGSSGMQDQPGQPGGNSSFAGITAYGGGRGGGYSSANGGTGGSGGGGSGPTGSGSGGSSNQTSPAGGTGYGNPGGSNGGSSSQGGGGGGAVGAGTRPNGGAGRASSISGTSVYYAGGGAGWGGSGGIGGGGNPGSPGTPNRGGGGGGTGDSPNGSNIGGSGIVIIRYPF